MNEQKTQGTHKHEIVLVSRNKMRVEGVKDVVSFDENQAVLVTVCGEAVVEGRGLHISVLDLDSGRVELDGQVDGLFYNDEKETVAKGGFFSRLFG